MPLLFRISYSLVPKIDMYHILFGQNFLKAAIDLKMELIWRIQILFLLSEPKGFTCDLCVNLLTEIENILEDQTIDDAVITFFSYIS